MSLIVVPFGSSNDVTVPAGGVVTAFSQGSYTVLAQTQPGANIPPAWNVLAQVPAGAPTYVSSAFASGAVIRIDAGGGSEVSYDVGSSPSPKLARAISVQGATVTAVNTSATLTGAQIAGGFITSTTAAAVSATLPTGAVLDASGSWGVGEGVIWHVSNTGGTNAITVVTASNNTLNGSGAVAANTTGQFITFKTAAGVFQTWRT
jgi:hypothetical protein